MNNDVQIDLPQSAPHSTAACGLMLLGAFGVWCVLLSACADSTYWRDAAEFISAAFFLDITHPPGAPLYSQLGNAFALLPLGPIAWRVNAFSTFVASANSALLYLLASRLLCRIFGFSRRRSYWIALSAPLAVCCSPAFLRQALSAEVYMLNALVVLFLLHSYLNFRQSNDLRWILMASFIGGLGLSNHISIAVILVPAIVMILAVHGNARSIVIPALLLGLVGCSLYGYLPARAFGFPPLNTGAPDNPVRLFRLMTDARDRDLKTSAHESLEQNTEVNSAGSHLLSLFDGEWRKVSREMSVVLAICAVLGLATTFLRARAIATLLIILALGNWAFFMQWDPEPWIVLFIVFGLGVTLFFAQLRRWHLDLLGPILAVCIVPWRSQVELAVAVRELKTPAREARVLLQDLPARAVFLTEASWFPLNYLQNIEGFRDDIFTLYQPRLLFPDYFEPIGFVRTGSGVRFHSRSPRERADSQTPYFDNLGGALRFLNRPAYLEPSVVINQYLAPVVSLEADGARVLRPGQSGALDSGYLGRRLALLAELDSVRAELPQAIRGDVTQYFEILLTNEADLLVRKGHPDLAVTLIRQLCYPEAKNACTPRTFFNLAQVERIARAAGN